MARGFESKDVEFQQAEAERRTVPSRELTQEERARAERRSVLQLSLARARGDLAASRSAAHQRMLREAIHALETELSSVE